MTDGMQRPAPRNALIANGLSLVLFIVLTALEWSNRSCGDGLCGSIVGGVVVAALVLATFFFVFRGLTRGEKPRWLFAIPPVFWLLLLPRLFA